MRSFHRARNDKGFSLIEMSIMIVVSSFLFISLGRAVMGLTRNAIENRNYTIALNIAKWQMGKMNNAAYPAVVAETAQAADAAFPSFIPTQTVVAVAASGTNSIRQITVRVRLNSVTGPVLIRLDTYRSNIITFGNGT